jgi:hypothetical protein
MASTINTTNIDVTYPIAGQDNDTQGFRDNFRNIKNNLNTAASEITALQSNAITLQSTMTNLATNANANVATYLPTYSGNIAAGNVAVTGNITVGGNRPLVSNVARQVWVANVAPAAGQGSVGDIWYQTF